MLDLLCFTFAFVLLCGLSVWCVFISSCSRTSLFLDCVQVQSRSLPRLGFVKNVCIILYCIILYYVELLFLTGILCTVIPYAMLLSCSIYLFVIWLYAGFSPVERRGGG